MKLTRDQDHNVAYLSLVDESIKVGQTVPVYTKGGQLNIDLDERGALLGVEFMNADVQLAALDQEARPTPTESPPPTPIPPSQWPEGET